MKDRGKEEDQRKESPVCNVPTMVDGTVLTWIKDRRQLLVRSRQINGTILRTVTLVDTHPVFSRLISGLNGDRSRVDRVFQTRAQEFLSTGNRIAQAEVITHPDTRTPVYGVQSKDPNERARIRVFFAVLGDRSDPVFALITACRATEDRTVLNALSSFGYQFTQGQRGR